MNITAADNAISNAVANEIISFIRELSFKANIDCTITDDDIDFIRRISNHISSIGSRYVIFIKTISNPALGSFRAHAFRTCYDISTRKRAGEMTEAVLRTRSQLISHRQLANAKAFIDNSKCVPNHAIIFFD